MKKSIIGIVAFMLIAVTAIVAKTTKSSKDCCYKGSPCCYEGSPCCEKK